MKILGFKISDILCHNRIRYRKGSNILIAKSARIHNVRLEVMPGASLVIGNNCILKNVNIYVGAGSCVIDDFSIIGNQPGTTITIDNGDVHIGHHTKIAAKRIWVRFGGQVKIGNYTNINSGSELRCDEQVEIGDYNQISFNVNIWDTNTHCMLSNEERRELTEKYYPYYGKETVRPCTRPIYIGSDCWIGQSASILKGSKIGNGAIVGYACIVAGKFIPAGYTAVTDVKLKLIEHNK